MCSFMHMYSTRHTYVLHCKKKLWIHQNYKIAHMESCSNQKSVKQIQIYFIFKILQMSHPDDSFAHSWHSPNQLHEECFSNSLEGVLTYAYAYAEYLLAAFPSLCGPTHPKPSSQLGWGRVTVEAKSSDAALHHSPCWLYSPYTDWRWVFGHCPVENKW